MFRRGILSGAKITKEHLMPAISESHNGIISGIACKNPEDAKALVTQFNINQVFVSYDDLLASADIDGIYIFL